MVGSDPLVSAANEGAPANVGTLTVALSGVQPATAVATINLSSVGDLAVGSFNTTGTITAAGGSTVVIDGNANLNIDGFTSGAIVNASAHTGILVIEGSEFTGAVGAVGVSATAVGAGTNGVDAITLAANTVVDRIEFSSAADSGQIVVGAGPGFALTGAVLHDVVSGFVGGTGGDVLDFGAPAGVEAYNALAAASQTLINNLAGGAATLAAAANLAADGNNNVAGWTSFNFQGSAYALNETGAADNAGGYTNADLLVELTGISAADLTSANFA